jgi:SAM-dependent methyltransferase
MFDPALKFYDAIASSYDSLVESYPLNAAVRETVSSYFIKNVPKSAAVMDFGGGTGLDLPWLLEAGFRVYFCEPSGGMRQQAIDRVQRLSANPRIEFMQPQDTNWLAWLDPGRQPPCRVDAILANLAVLNCISAIETAFAALAAVLAPKGHFITTVLDTSRLATAISPRKWRRALSAWRCGEDVKSRPQLGDATQVAYHHSQQRLVKAARWWFRLVSRKRINDFILLDFERVGT